MEIKNTDTPTNSPAEILAALGALAQQTRLSIFRLLVAAGPEGLAVGIIADRLGLANATLSFHLRELSHAALVSSAPKGRFIVYTANFATINTLITYLTENCCQGQPCLPEAACSPTSLRQAHHAN
ncbi:MAG: helix-turn-helix transcriptional regulator [Betaproteobacteria bacterium]|nr:helix-turn-helix transcriptional regulator [Betaproteobacteria bacterium]